MKTATRRAAVATASAALLTLGAAGTASAGTEVDEPSTFTSAFTVHADPDTIINADGESVPGAEGGSGEFHYRVNSDEEIICYDLTTRGVQPPYESPAKTATHIHEAVEGEAGPPRLAFPDPEGDGDVRTSSGCLQGPFTTGLTDDDDVDTAEGFSLRQIEDDPESFFGDTHTEEFPAGAVRGQLVEMPVGGVDTGLGGSAD
ncbi:CHRD domain-containing protein, partial [Streptomyces sp. SM12]